MKRGYISRQRYVVSCVYGDPIDGPDMAGRAGKGPVQALVLDSAMSFAPVAAFTHKKGNATAYAKRYAAKLNREERRWERQRS